MSLTTHHDDARHEKVHTPIEKESRPGEHGCSAPRREVVGRSRASKKSSAQG